MGHQRRPHRRCPQGHMVRPRGRGQGGGVLDFLQRQRVGDPWEWLRERGYGGGGGGGDNGSNGRGTNSQHKIVASYDYTDEFGTGRCSRSSGSPQKHSANGGLTAMAAGSGIFEGVTRVLYRLPDLMGALALERRVFVVGKTRMSRRWRGLGIVSTCNPGGAGKWEGDAYADQLVGADVVVLPDHDKAGRDHAHAVARSLVGKAARVRMLVLPGLADKGDASDWFGAGGTIETFNALVDRAPDWTDNGTGRPTSFRNTTVASCTAPTMPT